MPAPHRDTAKTVTINGKIYPLGGQVERSQLGIFPRRFTQGDAQFDSDDYQSAQIYSNFSGGIGIEDSDEGADATRFWFGVCDSRSPRMLALPPLVTATKPGAATGTCRPLGVIGTQFYAAFTATAFGYNDTGAAWHATANALGFAPVNKPVKFDGNVWIPQGVNGIRSVTETTAGTGTLTVANITATPEAAGLAIWNNKLYAIATDGDLWVLPQGSVTWAAVANSAGVQLRVNTGETPKNLLSYFNRAGEPTLWLITTGSAYQFYETAVEWRQSNIKFPPHPDNGRSACVWRTGEDLWITNGMDIVRQTTGNAIVPLGSGVSRDQGVPQEFRGTIHDIEPEISQLFALVGSGSEATAAYAFNATVGAAGTGNGQFVDVRGLSVTSGGNVDVCDENNERIQRFNSGLTFVSVIVAGGAGSGNGQFASDDGPYDIAHDSADKLFVVDRGNSRVQRFSAAGAFEATFGSFGVGNGQFVSPQGIDIKQSSGRIYVTDTGSTERVQYFTSAGVFEGTWGSNGTGDGQLNDPRGIAVNQSTGTVYVVDTGNDRVQYFSATGTFLGKWGGSGLGDGQFSFPVAIAIHPTTGNVFVTDATRDDVQEFTSTGVFVRKFGTSGTGNGQFSSPHGIAIDSTGASLYVSDQTNEDVQKFLPDIAFSMEAAPTLHAWPGTGWHTLWAGSDSSVAPTWMTVSAATAHYRLWWGADDGNAYYLTLFRGFENVNQARIAGTAFFAASGYLLTSKFDAGMMGFPKLASHVVLFPVLDSISSTETILVEFSVDDGGWESLGTVNATTLGTSEKVTFSFGATGRTFNSIRFRLSGARGLVTTLSPMLRGMCFLFNKIPQPARSFVFTILPTATDDGTGIGRNGQVMFSELDALADSHAFFDISYGGLTVAHCRFAGSTGQDNTADLGGKRVVSIIELPTGA